MEGQNFKIALKVNTSYGSALQREVLRTETTNQCCVLTVSSPAEMATVTDSCCLLL